MNAIFFRKFISILIKIELYFIQKTVIEKIIVISLIVLSLFVLTYFYIIPLINAQTNNFYNLIYYKISHEERERNEALKLQEFQEQNLIISEIKKYIDLSYKPILKLEEPWKNIIQEISKVIYNSSLNIHKIQFSIDNENYVDINTTLVFSDFIFLINLLETHIPLLEISKIGTININNNISYNIRMKKISYPEFLESESTSAEDIKNILSTYLISKDFLHIPTFTQQQTIRERNNTVHTPTQKPNIKIQAILNKKAKINNKWLQIGEIYENYTLRDIQSCGVILEIYGEYSCYPISIKK